MTARGPHRASGAMTRIRRVAKLLQSRYGSPRHHNKDDPLDELVFILLSTKTSERAYLRTYDRLKTRFPDWFSILGTPSGTVHEVIAEGGLSRKKEAQIRATLLALAGPTPGDNKYALEKMTDQELESFLAGLPGVGLKSARCVMMYSLGRRVFPVDTHCRRVLSRIGLIRFRRLTDAVQDEIQEIVPPRLRYDLHVDLVAHGRALCLAANPRCDDCPLTGECGYYRKRNPPRQVRRRMPVASATVVASST